MKEFNISQLMAQDGVIRAVKIYGLEGTEEVIKRVYRKMPKIKKLLLEEYKKLIWRKR